MKNFKKACVVFSMVAAAGCSNGNEGRIVGFLVDGQTGQRLNWFKAEDSKNNIGKDEDSKSQVYAVVDGEFVAAKPCGKGDLNKSNAIEADGCFQIDGIPLGQSVPVFAQGAGYERFHGIVDYPQWSNDYDHDKAQYVGNIRVFPTGYAVDYRFQVNYAGRGVPDTKVNCQYLQNFSNSLETSGSRFITPMSTGSTTLSATTDANGVATLPGAQLVNGATYHCEAVMNQAFDGRVLSGETNIVAGVSAADQALSLGTGNGTPDQTLYAVSSNADYADALLGANGKLVITFNRPIEIAARTADCQVALLSEPDTDRDTQTGRLVTDVTGNSASESVSADVSADGLTLTLGFKVEQPLDTGDLGTTVLFSGILVHPRGATDGVQTRYIGGLGLCQPFDVPYTNAQVLRSVRAGVQPSAIRLF
ncbi:hypothetical protein JGU66_02205 [Myxococcaceae bacterium JPH2]|nr:hypothetical protein [Myxococcaceae bacterium JPH2]